MSRYPLRMWHDNSGWEHAYSAQDEAAYVARGWIAEDVFRARKAAPVLDDVVPDEVVEAPPAEQLVKRGPGRPRKA